MNMKTNRGFTLVEVLISMALASVAITAANYQYVSQIQAQKGLSLQQQNRQLLNQVVAQLTSSPAMFPKMIWGGYPATFVACFDQNNALVPNAADGTVGFM